MMKLLQPNLWVDNLQEIPLQQLQSIGIKGLMIDIDNTLVAWDQSEPAQEVRQWVTRARTLGFQVVLVSNNHSLRVDEMQAFFMVHGFSKAKKPTLGTLKKAIRLMGFPRQQVAMIGDQIFTDVLGGNRLGVYTILVTPIKSKEFWWTTLVRPVEARVLHRMKKFRNHG
ncbi:YqeG family HAD IIIA-type phosphatase [Anoxynatronum sibiricum]|uniref:YqeG family HAD IIIA-type phosphatase n=1 Tax=Anoxynatronum sibiricum TaxID=210623 RepID=A0ABU9VT05_9CLOT